MASQSPSESLQGEASCSICLGYFQEPVSIPCGHNFCRECITRCWQGLEANFSCPQCRQTASHKSFRPSRELAKIAEIAQQLSLQAGRGAAGHEGWCQQHQEALKLFCKEDQQPICTVCDRSQAHRLHTVLPAEEAAQEYKVKHWDVLAAFPAHQKSLGKGKTQPSACIHPPPVVQMPTGIFGCHPQASRLHFVTGTFGSLQCSHGDFPPHPSFNLLTFTYSCGERKKKKSYVAVESEVLNINYE